MSSTQIPPSSLAPTVSPLTEADPNAINDLIKDRIDDIFNTPPTLKDAQGNYVLTDEKLKVMVEYYRRERLRFMQESLEKENKPKTSGPRKKPPTSIAEAIAASTDLL